MCRSNGTVPEIGISTYCARRENKAKKGGKWGKERGEEKGKRKTRERGKEDERKRIIRRGIEKVERLWGGLDKANLGGAAR